MKDYLPLHYSKKMFYDKLRTVCKKAYNQIEMKTLRDLLKSMSAHCQTVINVNELHTKY